MINEFLSKQFVIFLLTGGTAALVNFVSRIFYNQWLGFSLSVILAYVTGMVVAFTLARIFVFKQNTQPVHHSIFYFSLVNLAGVFQTFIVSTGLAYYLFPLMEMEFFTLEIAHAIGIAVPAFTSYIGHKRWSFK